MRLMYCDESNLEERTGDFLVYGGAIINAEQALVLSSQIETLRTNSGVRRGERLKFLPAPTGLDHHQHLTLKQEIINAAITAGVRLVICLTLHDLATSPDDARRNGINTICYHYDCMLRQQNESGLVLIDRFTDNQIDAHLIEKFSVGITGLPHTPRYQLERILGYHYSAIGQSHFTSLIDILVGSFRFAINAHTRAQTGNANSARSILRLLEPMFHRSTANQHVSELSLMFSPKNIRSAAYYAKYISLQNWLTECGIDTEQLITND